MKLKLILGLFVLAGIMNACSKTETPAANAGQGAQTVKSSPKSVQPKNNWEYKTFSNEMDGSTQKAAFVESTNKLDFKFPYNGGSTAIIGLYRYKDQPPIDNIDPQYSQSISLIVTKGQFSCGYGGCSVRIKFDDQPAERISAWDHGNGRTDIIRIGRADDANHLIAKIAKAKTMKIEAEFFTEGHKVISFDVSGLNGSKLQFN